MSINTIARTERFRWCLAILALFPGGCDRVGRDYPGTDSHGPDRHHDAGSTEVAQDRSVRVDHPGVQDRSTVDIVTVDIVTVDITTVDITTAPDVSVDTATDAGDAGSPDLAPVEPIIAQGDDWSLPGWVAPTANTGFFSEFASPSHHVDVRVVDLSWRQLNPTQGSFSTTGTGSAQGMNLDSYDDQLAGSDPFWMRVWASGTSWAPAWVAADCGVSSIGTDYDGQQHLPIWNPCVWGHLLDLYRTVFIDWGLRSDPRLRFIYVPGAFTWCEFDFDMISSAADHHGLTYAVFNSWFQQAMQDLVDIFNGENSDPGDDQAHKLVYTGEDYPWGPWDARDDFFARDAVEKGMGIRTGIPELFNFHLNEIPAYGTVIGADGHLVTDESWPLLSSGRIVATEVECINECGYHTADPYYAVKMSVLRSLQMRSSWIYVYPGPSYMSQYPELWEFARHALGKRADTSADAWAVLREARDRYWVSETSRDWDTRPWVINWERWLVQRDVVPGGVSARGSTVQSEVLDPHNDTSYEGRRTDHVSGNDNLYFDVAEPFLDDEVVTVDLKVTYLNEGGHSWRLEYATHQGVASSAWVALTDSGGWRTATFHLEQASFDDSLPGGTDFRLHSDGSGDLEVWVVRVVKTEGP